jgi:hypothetical protein
MKNSQCIVHWHSYKHTFATLEVQKHAQWWLTKLFYTFSDHKYKFIYVCPMSKKKSNLIGDIYKDTLPMFKIVSSFSFVLSQTSLALTKFIEKYINI